MDWEEVIAEWNAAVAAAGHGQQADLARLGDQRAVRAISQTGIQPLQFRSRADLMLSEGWREYFTLSALWNAWEALGEKLVKLERKKRLDAQQVGNPPTKIEEIRRMWSEPPLRAGDPAHQRLSAWLQEHQRQA